jgi:hypothetical protein
MENYEKLFNDLRVSALIEPELSASAKKNGDRCLKN